MLFYIIDLALCAAIILMSFLTSMISGLSQLFFFRIDFLNGLLFGGATGVAMYLNHRKYPLFPLDMDIHPAICVAVGIIVMIVVIRLQHTKVGFWIFTILMSIVWALIPTLLVLEMTNGDFIWGILVAVIAFLLNLASHLRTRIPASPQTTTKDE